MALGRRLADVLELLQSRHGIGSRREACPGWFEARLARTFEGIAERTGRSGDDLVRALKDDPALLTEIAEALRVGETRFYRDPLQWDALRAFLADARGSRIRALSVGCSTGEEAWTLAMCLDEARSLGAASEVSILGMDRSAQAVETARLGEYPRDAARNVPKQFTDRYLVIRGDILSVNEPLRAAARFVQRDLVDGVPPGSYEVIVCKNVLIYFGEDAGRRAVGALLGALAHGGVLLVARSEVQRLRAMGHRAVQIGPQIAAFGARVAGGGARG